MRSALASAALCLFLAACGGDAFDAGRYDVTGRWTGTATVADSGSYEFDLDLIQEEEDISGSGEVTVAGRTIPVTVTGLFAFPGVDLTLRSTGFVPLGFDGTFRRDTVPPSSPTDTIVELDENRGVLVGTLNGSALENIPLTIVRDTTP